MQTYRIRTISGIWISHIPPVDTTTPETWADSLIARAEAVIQHGFGLCHDGVPYDQKNFVADMAGDVPWDQGKMILVQEAAYANPRYQATLDAWQAKFGNDNWGI